VRHQNAVMNRVPGSVSRAPGMITDKKALRN
jgi:hypothetical protein